VSELPTPPAAPSDAPPAPGAAPSGILGAASRALRDMRRVPAALLSLGALLIVAVGDYVTAWDFLFDFFYLVPISLGAVLFGKRGGFLMALAATVTWLVDYTAHAHVPLPTDSTRSLFVLAWDFAGRLAILTSFAWLVARAWDERERQSRLLAELRDALEDVKRLHDLLPICAWCKKIRDDRGYWQQLEGYMQEHDIATFTHGICPDCVEKLRTERQKA
jgi:hypothetical protein